MLISLLIASFAIVLRDQNKTSLLLRGDFPAFYAAGHIAASGNYGRLYDPQTQQQVENRCWPSLEGRYYAFAYPPYVALLFAPLASLPPVAAKILLTGLMLLALAGSAYFSIRLVPELRESFYCTFLFFLFFAPITNGLAGGQNISLSMLLYTAALFFLVFSEERGEWIAGLCFGLWCFKPHYGLVAVLLSLIAGRWRVFLGALVPLAGFFLIATLKWGKGWLMFWINAVQGFSELDFEANRHQMVSILGLVKAFSGSFGGTELFAAIGILGALSLLVHFGTRFWHLRKCLEIEEEKQRFIDCMFLLGPFIVMLSPHTLYYDLGLCLPCLCRFYRLDSDRKINLAILFLLVCFVAVFVKKSLVFQPLALVAIFSYCLAAKKSAASLGTEKS